MKYSKIKNNIKISVLDWSNDVVITDKNTNKHIATRTFSNHIVAITIAKKL